MDDDDALLLVASQRTDTVIWYMTGRVTQGRPHWRRALRRNSHGGLHLASHKKTQALPYHIAIKLQRWCSSAVTMHVSELFGVCKAAAAVRVHVTNISTLT